MEISYYYQLPHPLATPLPHPLATPLPHPLVMPLPHMLYRLQSLVPHPQLQVWPRSLLLAHLHLIQPLPLHQVQLQLPHPLRPHPLGT